MRDGHWRKSTMTEKVNLRMVLVSNVRIRRLIHSCKTKLCHNNKILIILKTISA
jgi:hypothetical protein